jgi:hypothetical protein
MLSKSSGIVGSWNSLSTERAHYRILDDAHGPGSSEDDLPCGSQAQCHLFVAFFMPCL